MLLLIMPGLMRSCVWFTLTACANGLTPAYRGTTSINLRYRDEVPTSSITVAPQTAFITGALRTDYLVLSDQTTNSEVTQTINGTATILPVWYCDPDLDVPACAQCPTSSLTGQAPCPTDFNFLLVVPPFAIVGGLVPPPEGLPTLSIGPDGSPTPKTTDSPNLTSAPPFSTEQASSTSSETSISISVPCTTGTINAIDFAFSAMPLPTWTPPAGSAAPSLTEALPVLPLTNADPAKPTMWAACGPGNGNAYYNGGFFQFGNTFSRNAGLDAVGKFCDEMVKSGAVAGPSGLTGTFPGASKKTAVPMIAKSYTEPDGSGDILLYIQSDISNKNGVGSSCPDKWIYDIAAGGYAKCRQLFGVSVDYCDVDATRKSSDIMWKAGGTIFTNCMYFALQKAPAGGGPQT